MQSRTKQTESHRVRHDRKRLGTMLALALRCVRSVLINCQQDDAPIAAAALEALEPRLMLSASIAGQVFHDLDANGVNDGGDSPLAGWTVYVDANNNSAFDGGEVSDVTDGGGNYLLPNLPNGVQRVRQIVPAGWSVIAPGGGVHVVVVHDGDALGGYDFADHQLPVADAGGGYAINEGQNLTVTAGGSTGTSLTYAWDLDNDGQYDDAAGVNPTINWAALAGLGLASDGSVLTVGLRVTDAGGLTDTDTTTLTVANLVPVADMAGPYAIQENDNLVLDASGSTDPGSPGDTLTYAWDIDNDGQYDDAVGVNPTITWAALTGLGVTDNQYTIGLKVTDSDGAADTTSTTLTLNPTAGHGGPYVINEGQNLTLDASGSSDPGGEALTYAWDIDHDGQYDDAAGVNPTVTWATLVGLGLPSDTSVLTVGLRVTDPGGRSDVAMTTLTITNLNPVAATTGPHVINEGQSVTLDASGSTDAGGDALTYAWDIDNDGQYDDAVGVNPTVNWATLVNLVSSDGVANTIRVRVTDADGGSSTASTTLTANNLNPIADAGGAYVINEGTNPALNAGGSSDPGSDALTYAWDLDNDGQYDDAAGATVTWAALRALGMQDGAFNIALRVTDADGATDTDATTLTINNLAPNADMGGAYNIQENDSFSPNASGTSDPGGDVLTYEWDIDNDGQYDDATGVNPSFTWAALNALGLVDDLYTIRLRVTDSEGATDTDSTTLRIRPTADAGGAYAINEGQNVTLNAAASTDPGGDPLTYAWDIDNDGQYDDAVGVNPTVTWATLLSLGLASDGTALTVRVRATDPGGSQDTDSTTLTITNLNPVVVVGDYVINEGQNLTVSGAGSSDAGSDALTYAWDLDHDGQYDDAVGVNPTIAWATLLGLGLVSDGSVLTIGLRITDSDAGVATNTGTLRITNLNPLGNINGPYDIQAGDVLALSAAGSSDPGSDALTYAWDVDNDGQYDDAAGANPNLTYAALVGLGVIDDVHTLGLRITDPHGGVYQTTTTLTIRPTAAHGGAYTINEGQTLNLSAAASTDPGNDPLTYAWDLDNDGQYDDAVGATPSLNWAQLTALGLTNGPHTLGVQVRDPNNLLDTASTTVTINNLAPVADAGGGYVINEGQNVTLTAAGSTDPGNDPLTYAWDVDNDGAFDDAVGVNPTVTWATLFGLGLASDGSVLTVRVRATDDLGATHVDTTTLTINNLAPVAVHNGGYVINEALGVVLSAAGSSDPGGDALTYAWDIDHDGQFDDAAGLAPFLSRNDLIALGLASDGTMLPIALRVTDADGAVTEVATTLTITNVAPFLAAGGPYNANEGQSLVINGAIAIDPGLDPLTVAWDLDNDGQYDDSIGTNPTVLWATLFGLGLASDGSALPVSVRATDSDGAVTTAATTIVLNNLAPVADAGGGYVINEGQNVTFTAAGSSDPGSDPLTYAWDVDNDGAFDDAVGVNPTVTWATLAGLGLASDGSALTVRVRATDDAGATHIDTTTLTINNLNPLPVAGGAYLINEGQSVTLSAAGTSDPGSDALTYAWDLDNDGQYDDAVGNNPTVNWATLLGLGLASDGSALPVAVRVTDSDGGTAVAATTLTITNLAPLAQAGGAYVINEGQPVTLNAGASSDPGSDALTFAWDLDNDGQYDDAVGGNPTVNWATLFGLGLASDTSALPVAVRVTDSDGAVTTAATTLTITNLAPVAQAGAAYLIDEGQTLNLTAAGTSDPGSDALTYAWDLDNDGQYDDAVGFAASINWNSLVALGLVHGAHPISLRVTDDQGLTQTDASSVIITNLAPTADAGGPYAIDEGQSLTLVASGSTDPGGDALTYAWDLDHDGQYDDAAGVNPTINWSQLVALGLLDGPYTLGLRVTDAQGATDTDTTTLTITNLNPVANAGGSGGIYVIDEGQGVTFSAAASTDPGNDALTYAWDLDHDGQYDDAVGVTVTLDWAGLAGLGLVDGAYVISVRAQDTQGATHTAGTTLTINNLPPTGQTGGPYTIYEGQGVTLSGASATDPGLDVLTYAWDLDGDGQFDDATALNPVLTWTDLKNLGLYIGPHNLALRVTDAQGASHQSMTTITILGIPPIAAVEGPYVINEGQSLVLDATDSSDASGEPLTYAWDIDHDGQYDDAAAMVATLDWPTLVDYGLTDGQHTLGLRVTDATNDTHAIAVSLTVQNLAPVPSAAAVTLNEDQSLSLDASGSFDPGGDQFSFSWDLDGDGIFDDASQSMLTLSPANWRELGLGVGSNHVTLKVTDDQGASSTLAVPVTIVNLSPTAVVEGPTMINQGQAVSFSGAGSSDPGQGPLRYTWSMDGQVFVNQSLDPAVSLSASQVRDLGWGVGVHTLTLHVDDQQGGGDTASLAVTIHNLPPIAVASPGGERYLVPELHDIVLDATDSFDPGDDALEYAWDIDGDGHTDLTGATPHLSWQTLVALDMAMGRFQITLRVTDSHGATSSAGAVLVVANQPPIADAHWPVVIDQGDGLTLDASHSTDPDGDAVTYAWDLDGDGNFNDALGIAPVLDWSALVALGLDVGTFNAGLRVTDIFGSSDTTTGSLTITNLAPQAHAGESYTLDQGQAIDLSAADSSDPGDDALTFAWDLDGDGQFDDAAGESPTLDWATLHSLGLVSGEYPIAVRVTDVHGLTDQAGTTLTVNNTAPTAVINAVDQINEGQSVTLDALSSSDADQVTQVAWDLDNDGAFDDATDPQLSLDWAALTSLGLVNASHVIRLRVTDAQGAEDVTQHTLDVINLSPVAVTSGPYTLNEGQALLLDAAGSHDPGDDALTFAWDLDNDGSFDDATNASPLLDWPALASLGITDGGQYPIRLQVVDADGASDIVQTMLTVNDTAPTLTHVTVIPGMEAGDPIRLRGDFLDSDLEQIALTIDWGDGQVEQFGFDPQASSFELPHSYPAATVPNLYTILITLTDGLEGSARENMALTVNVGNEPPEVSGFALAGLEDQSIAFSAAMFLAHFYDAQGHGLQSVRIDSLPALGRLLLAGQPVATGQMLTLTQLDTLTFVPDADATGQSGFNWNASDGRLFAQQPATVSLDLQPVDDPPTVTSLSTSSAVLDITESLTLSGDVHDPDSTVARLNVYHDSNADGVLDPLVDALLLSVPAQDGAFAITLALGDLPMGEQRLFVVPMDDNDVAGSAVSTTVSLGRWATLDASSLTLINDADQTMTLKLRGPGSLSIFSLSDDTNAIDADAMSLTQASWVRLTDTSPRSRLVITSDATMPAAFTGNLKVTDDLGALVAPGVVFQGRLEFTAAPRRVIVAGLAQGAALTVSQAEGLVRIMRLGAVRDAMIDSAAAIRRLVVEQWQDSDDQADRIDAPWLGGLVSQGDFSADVNLSGRDSGRTLASMVVRGMLSHACVSARGNVGLIVLGGMDHSELRVGLGAQDSLPTQPGDFDALAAVGRLVLTGLPGEPLLSESTIAAGRFNLVRFAGARSEPGLSCNLLADVIGRYRRVTPNEIIRFNRLDQSGVFDQLTDYQITLL